MRRALRWVAVALVAMLAWAALVGADAWFGWSRAPIAARGDAQAFFEAAASRIDRENRGNAILVVIEQGRVVGVHDQTIGAPVNDDTLFQVASLSKWVTAWGVMTLVEQGEIDLDAPVSRYLTRWRLPDSPYNEQVTVRRILSHTAGFTDGLGYGGFLPDAPVQTLEESLTAAGDAAYGANGVLRVGREPGSWQYSGGGYTLLQLLIEEISGEPFNDYMRRAVLAPLGMHGSTFVLDDASRTRVAEFYDTDGARAPHYAYTATAAASLYTSAADLTRFVEAQAQGAQGEPAGRGVLRPETLALMAQPEAALLGAPFWGLGMTLYGRDASGGFLIGHDGGNRPAINTTVRTNPETGDGIIVLLTGNVRLASELGGEWTFWKAGVTDVYGLMAARNALLMRLLAGWAVIVVVALALWWRGRRARSA